MSHTDWLSAHVDEQLRADGEKISHILKIWSADETLITAGLFYPALAHQAVLCEEAKTVLDDNTLKMIEGAAAIDLIHTLKQQQAESLRKMMLAMVDDIRTILLKLAERLFLITELKRFSPEKQRAIAQETLDYYAPLANRLGMGQLKWQLEDGAFAFLEPTAYEDIVNSLHQHRAARERIIQDMKTELKKLLNTQIGSNHEILGRVKHIYSIYKKSIRKKVNVSHIFDSSALRVIVLSIKDCYHALSLVHNRWEPIQTEFDDYIVKPKVNGYQSIHTTILREDNTPVEIQIRTKSMHEVAEQGLAAHWQYKEARAVKTIEADKINLLRELLDWQKHSLVDRENLYRSAFHDQVYVFSPKGDVYALKQGATPLDFAYLVHTSIGHRCRGAKLNGVIVPLTATLKTGDHVDIITAKEPHPSHDWIRPELGYLKTPRAIQKVKHWYRKLATDTLREKAITETHTPHIAIHKVKASEKKKYTAKVTLDARFLIHIACCCNPGTRDDIVGYITQGRGISIHKKSCHNMQKALKDRPEKLMDIDWKR